MTDTQEFADNNEQRIEFIKEVQREFAAADPARIAALVTIVLYKDENGEYDSEVDMGGLPEERKTMLHAMLRVMKKMNDGDMQNVLARNSPEEGNDNEAG